MSASAAFALLIMPIVASDTPAKRILFIFLPHTVGTDFRSAYWPSWGSVNLVAICHSGREKIDAVSGALSLK
jgi:hypothetical protein